jgi:hypothetical protein
MLTRKLTATLAILAATAGVSVFAASAGAVVVDNDFLALDSDEDDLSNGNVAFDMSDGLVYVDVTGLMSIEDGDDTCARIRRDYYDDDDVYLDTQYTPELCVQDDDRHEWGVVYHGTGHALTDKVVVAIEKQSLSTWTTQDDATFYLNTHDDSFQVLRQGIDIGLGGFAGGAPVDDAEVRWPIENGLVTPEFEMELYLDNLAGVCGRINVRFLKENGNFLDSRASNPRCAPDNNSHHWPLAIPTYTSGLIGKVEVEAQTRVANQWVTSGSRTVSIKE